MTELIALSLHYAVVSASGMEEITKYLNQAHVQKQMGVENQIDFKTVNMDLNEQWSKASELFVPTSREVAAILDKKHTRVLVINGNNDIIVYVCKCLWSEKDSPAANACL
ncbi:hypothetical protein COL940_007611 [Colletotrichum noveboracense]|nr:hypothetical protein COL940_007611 [Colletotrichum noveboracense]KAJ0281369.1 hypothetical protein CBS470a_008306 [Colletotrichum nupharicola]